MTNNVKEFVSWMGIFGIPSLFAIISFLIKWFIKSYKQMKTLAKATQAQIRSQLLKDYHKYMDQGWIYDSDLEDWQNQWEGYHELGKNGVMDERHKAILSLPTRPDV